MYRATGVHQNARPSQFAILPSAAVRTAVGPHEGSLAVLGVLLELALEGGAVRPLHDAVALHVALLPLAFVNSAVGKSVRALTVETIPPELPFIHDAHAEIVVARAVLAIVHVFAPIRGLVRVRLLTPAGLLVLLPLAFVPDPAAVPERALAVPLAPPPLAIVGVAVGCHVAALPVHLAVGEAALVALVVGALQDAAAVLDVPFPLARVPRAVYKLHGRALLKLGIVATRARQALLLELGPDEEAGGEDGICQVRAFQSLGLFGAVIPADVVALTTRLETQ
mmetsp:Transcript_33502/g.94035  ORF Transcript_33502/g.94035 Transcript_33502/m.94035 type:complete len:281 (+) Transcript_33502:494-1336(+)